MALTAGVHLELRNGGSDTNCSGGFDPAQTAGMYTDGAATSANTAAPVFSSASYNFVAGDVGAYVFIGAGTNWTKGWYVIASVASNNATLTATAAGYQAHGDSFNTSAGCASVASPTGATWSIDYSQQDAARNTFTDLTFVTGTTFTSATVVFGKQLVGNVLKITGGTNYTVGSYVITGVTGTTATLNGTACSGASSNGAGSLGGAYASIGAVGAVHVSTNTIWVKYSASPFIATSTTNNVANGRFTLAAGSVGTPSMISGYDTVRGAIPTNRPTLQWGVNGASQVLVISAGNGIIQHLIVDGVRGTYTSTAGLYNSSDNALFYNCKAMRCSIYGGISATGVAHVLGCEITDCTGSSYAIGGAYTVWESCYIHDCSMSTHQFTANTGFVAIDCIFDSCTTFVTFSGSSGAALFDRCVFYGSTGAPVAFTATPKVVLFKDCIFEGGSTYGVSASAAYTSIRFVSCAFYNNTSGKYQNMSSYQSIGEIVPTVSPFVDAANGDFRLNMKAGGGALLRGAGYPQTFPGLTYAHRRDIGAHQHSGPKRGING